MAKTPQPETETLPQRPKMAFQCRNCGAVEPPDAAGDNEVPSACHVCRAGVEWKLIDGQPHKVYHPENWIKLAELTPPELAKGFVFHGLKPENVVKHAVFKFKSPPGGIVHEREAVEKIGAKDKAGSK
jgi:hypothetical protein